MKAEIIIRGSGEISPLGCNKESISEAYNTSSTAITLVEIGGRQVYCAALSLESSQALAEISEDRRYHDLDPVVHLALYAARQAVADAKWSCSGSSLFVNLASSRGATQLFETEHRRYLKSGAVGVLTSPSTTLGNIASSVLQDLRAKGFALSHSMTCSSGLQALANAAAWLKSGYAERALAGGSESPLSGFTLSQMRALKVYAQNTAFSPCQPLAKERLPGTGLVLGEGAAVQALELAIPQTGDIILAGFGLASETIKSLCGISVEGELFYSAMQQAMTMAETEAIDAIILHAPGTVAGDAAELKAVTNLFKKELPILLSNKWMLGHTFGAAGSLSLQYALHLLSGGKAAIPAFEQLIPLEPLRKTPRSILVNAAGFGGTAASVLLKLV